MISRKTFATLSTLVLALGLSHSAVAQRGGGGRPAGVGGGMGAGLGASAGGGAGRSDLGLGASAHANTGAQAPSMALSNTHLNTALNSSLTHSGVAIPGGNLQSACTGFKNLGQCVAALHVSHNLGIPFADLQSRMTGSGAVSLGKAIQAAGGANVNSKAEAKKGMKQANADLNAAAAANFPNS